MMAGARKFKLCEATARPSRDDIVALTPLSAQITGIPYISEHDKEVADEILSAA